MEIISFSDLQHCSSPDFVRMNRKYPTEENQNESSSSASQSLKIVIAVHHEENCYCSNYYEIYPHCSKLQLCSCQTIIVGYNEQRLLNVIQTNFNSVRHLETC